MELTNSWVHLGPCRSNPQWRHVPQHYSDNLAVLKISRCTFAFQSPPFCHCHSVRFLWLDHCQDTRISTGGIEDKEAVRRCFQRLWVLVVRYTSCDQILSHSAKVSSPSLFLPSAVYRVPHSANSLPSAKGPLPSVFDTRQTRPVR